MKRINVALGEFLAVLRKWREGLRPPETSFDRFMATLPDVRVDQVPMRLRETSEYFTQETMLRQNTRADWQNTDERLQIFAADFIEVLRRKWSIPVYVHSAYRTRAEQDRLFAERRTQTVWPRAAHCQGVAVDIVHSRFHWELTKTEWRFLGKVGQDIAEKHGFQMTWGGNWKSFYDPAHWELKNWRDDIRYFSGGTPVRFTPRGLRRYLALGA